MRRGLPIVAALLLAAAPPVQATAGGFKTEGVTGSTVSAAGAGLLDLDLANAAVPGLTISGPSARLLLVDEVTEDAFRFPVDPEADVNSIYGSPERYESSIDLGSFTMSLDAVTDNDATAIIVGGPGVALEATLDTRFQATEVEDQVIESSHTLNDGDNLPPWQYYEYRSGNGIELSTADGAEVVAQGDFQVYFWGQTLTYEDAASNGVVRTGYTLEASDGDFRQFDFVRDEHFRYAILSVTDGILHYTQSSGPIRLISPSIEAAPEGVTYHSASGSIVTPAGHLSFDDDFVRAEGGSYLWTLSDDDGLAVTVLQAPTSAIATNGAFVARDASSLGFSGVLPVMAGIAAVVLLAAYLYPTTRGGQTIPSGSGWSARRADGYASMAAAAETAGWHRLAAFWMGWSLRVVPADPMRMVDLAILRAQTGRHEDALTLHEAAHGWLVDAARGDHVAHNAYEAAKAAATLGRPSQALDWMRMALEADPGLQSRVGREPAFASLRGDPDYASLTVGGR